MISLNKLSWDSLTPPLIGEQTASSDKQAPEALTTYLDLQPRAVMALSNLIKLPTGNCLVLKGSELPESFNEIGYFLRKQIEQTPLSCSHYQIENNQTSLLNVGLNQTNEIPCVLHQIYADHAQLFGSAYFNQQTYQLSLTKGLLQQVNNGVLILGITALIQQPELWFNLKQSLLTQSFSPYQYYQSNPNLGDLSALAVPKLLLNFKLILVGDREAIAHLSAIDNELYSIADYAELDHYYLTQEDKQEQNNALILWCHYLVDYTEQLGLPFLSQSAVDTLYRWFIRETEDRLCVPCQPSYLKKVLQGSALFTYQDNRTEILDTDVDNYFKQQHYQANSLAQFSHHDIAQDYVHIQTKGSCIGQINGLSVIEYLGAPVVYGEPTRISCSVQFGEGELTDIERKNELAGNIHGKGTMLVQYCLANLLNLPSQLPFSAAIAFEQSYADIDGDSASLAEFCALVSALANVPIDQGIAVTGAIDQQGNVLSVGGCNIKIEGFYQVCLQQQLTGKQGVIIPAVIKANLSLSDEVVEAVKQQKFHIWAVDNVEQALLLLTEHPFFNDDDSNNEDELNNDALADLIMARIEQKSEQFSKSIMERMIYWFKKKSNE